jgi:hypothetical protein
VEEPNQTIFSFMLSKLIPKQHSKQEKKKPPKYHEKDQIKLIKGSLSNVENLIITAGHE